MLLRLLIWRSHEGEGVCLIFTLIKLFVKTVGSVTSGETFSSKNIKLFFGSAFGLRSFDFVEARLHLSKTKENQAFLWLCIRFALSLHNKRVCVLSVKRNSAA